MAAMSGISTNDFILSLVDDFVKFSNSILFKARLPKGYKLPVKAIGLNNEQPVAAIFPQAITTIRAAQDIHGNIIKYKQRSPYTGDEKEFKEKDVIHITYKKRKRTYLGSSLGLASS